MVHIENKFQNNSKNIFFQNLSEKTSKFKLKTNLKKMSSRPSQSRVSLLSSQTRSKTPYKKAMGIRKTDASHGMYSTIKSPSLYPQELNHDWTAIRKYAIKDLIKHINLGMRPSKLSKTSTVRYIEEIYSKLSKLRPKKFYEMISNESLLANLIYNHIVPAEKGPAVAKQSEKVLANFINSLEHYSQESPSCSLFSKVLASLIKPEGIAF